SVPGWKITALGQSRPASSRASGTPVSIGPVSGTPVSSAAASMVASPAPSPPASMAPESRASPPSLPGLTHVLERQTRPALHVPPAKHAPPSLPRATLDATSDPLHAMAHALSTNAKVQAFMVPPQISNLAVGASGDKTP